MTPLVSIIIPCYNQGDLLAKALESVLKQSLSTWECIIVNDGSTDNSAIIAKDFCDRDTRFIHIYKENGGSASARNCGMKHSKGKYIQFLDADDTIDVYKLEKQTKRLEECNIDICQTGFCFVYPDGTSTTYTHKIDKMRIYTQWGLGYSVPPHAFMYRADFIKDNNILFDEQCRYREDWNFLIQCLNATPKIEYITDYCGALYYQNEEGKTSSYIKMQEGNFIFMAYMCSQLSGWKKLLWTIRISKELWICILRMIKYRSVYSIRLINKLFANKDSLLTTIGAILFMPITLFAIMHYFVRTYIIK